jgi:hypothetical protein
MTAGLAPKDPISGRKQQTGIYELPDLAIKGQD